MAPGDRRTSIRLVGAPRFTTAPHCAPGLLPPNDLIVEAETISDLFFRPADVQRVIDVLEPRMFYSDANAHIFEAQVEVHKSGRPVDEATVLAWMHDRETLMRCGGESYVRETISRGQRAIHNVLAHAQILREKWRIRCLIAECQRIAAEGYGDVGEIGEYIRRASGTLEELAQMGETRTAVSAAASTDVAFAQMTALMNRGGQISGYSHGLAELDRLTGGMHGSSVILVGGETGRGKSALAANIAMHVGGCYQVEKNAGGVDVNVPLGVAFFTMEMPHEQVSMRMCCATGLVDWSKVRAGAWTTDDLGRLDSAKRRVSKLEIAFEDDADLTVTRLSAKVARIGSEMASRGVRLALVVIDYLQLMDGREDAERGANRERQLAEIGAKIKRLARRMTVQPRGLATSSLVWLELTQLNDDGQVRESRALEHHADAVYIIQHEKNQRPHFAAGSGPQPKSANIWIPKQRGGKRNVSAPVWWHESYVLFSDYERPDDPAYPGGGWGP